jgi:hypothetical protein
MMIRISFILSLLLILCTGGFIPAAMTQEGGATAQNTTELTTSVGFPLRILQTKIAGSRLIAQPYTDRRVPAMVRIIETFPHGSDFRYDIEFRGFEPGRFNVVDYLKRDDDSEFTSTPLWVNVEPILAADKVRPIPLPQNESQFRSYYIPILFVSGIVWLGGLLAILFYGRGTLKKASVITKTTTPAEKMRPLVDAAIAGNLTPAQQAELERILSEFWSTKLNLGHLPADQLRSTLREHPEATKMLEQIDFWLHRPAGEATQPVDVNALLKPYQDQNTTNASD